MTWPTSPFIHIISGEVEGYPIENTLAKHEPHYSSHYPDTYVVATGPYAGEPIVRGFEFDGIWEWHPVAVIPTEVVNQLHEAFYDNVMTEQQKEAFQAFEAHIF